MVVVVVVVVVAGGVVVVVVVGEAVEVAILVEVLHSSSSHSGSNNCAIY